MAEQHTDALYERRDVNPKWLAVTAAIIVAAIALILLLCALLWHFGTPDRGRPPPLAAQAPPVPAPQLQAQPRQDLQQFLQEKQARLESSGWVDREAGIAHIPIEQAMRHITEHGLPRWPQPATDTADQRAHQARQAAIRAQEADAR